MALIDLIFEHVSIKSFAVVLFGGLFLRFLVSRYIEHRKILSMGNYAPTVPSYLPFGFDFAYRSVKATMKHQNLEFWRDFVWLKQNSWTTETRPMNQRFVFTADPANIKALLATQFVDFGKGEPFHQEWKEFLGDSIFTTDGQQWHDSRQLIRPQFTRDRVSDLHCFESHVQTFFKTVANGGPLQGEHQDVDLSMANGRVVDVRDLFFRLTLDVTTEFLLGHDVKSLSNPKQEFAEAFNEVQRIQNIISRISKLRHLLPRGSFWSSLKVMNAFVEKYVQLALQMSPEELAEITKSEKGYTFLHELARFTRDPVQIRDQLVAVLLAGRDTTAGTLSWVIYEVSKRPDIVKKMRTEIHETVGKEATPTYEHLKNMPYLKNILNETLRLYPAVPFNVRMALKDAWLPRGGGPDGTEPLPVLKDTPIAYSTLVMQRRPDLYPPISEKFSDPAIFDPERWYHWHPKPHDYIPFNAGPRICIGQQFALTEMSYILCRIFQRFETVTSHMDSIDGGEPVLQADITLSPGQGVRVAFQEAQK